MRRLVRIGGAKQTGELEMCCLDNQVNRRRDVMSFSTLDQSLIGVIRRKISQPGSVLDDSSSVITVIQYIRKCHRNVLVIEERSQCT